MVENVPMAIASTEGCDLLDSAFEIAGDGIRLIFRGHARTRKHRSDLVDAARNSSGNDACTTTKIQNLIRGYSLKPHSSSDCLSSSRILSSENGNAAKNCLVHASGLRSRVWPAQ